MEYRGYIIRVSDYAVLVLDGRRKDYIRVEVESVDEAKRWIDIERDGYTDFRELD